MSTFDEFSARGNVRRNSPSGTSSSKLNEACRRAFCRSRVSLKHPGTRHPQTVHVRITISGLKQNIVEFPVITIFRKRAPVEPGAAVLTQPYVVNRSPELVRYAQIEREIHI